MKKYYPYICTLGVLIALDQMTKLSILKNFAEHEVYNIVPSFFNLTLVYNKGAAFGFLSTIPESLRAPFFFLIPLIAVVILGTMFLKGEDKSPIMRISLVLVMAGALGNFLDRLQYNKVVDFLDFYIPNCEFNILSTYSNCHWPAFNVADSCISVGIVGLLISGFLFEKRKKRLS